MSNVIHFKQRRPDAVDLEILKVQCWRSWFNTQTIPTEVVEALIDLVEAQQAELTEMRLEHAVWEKHSLVQIVTERNELRASLDRLWGDSEPHESGEECLECKRLATKEGYPWCDQCFAEKVRLAGKQLVIYQLQADIISEHRLVVMYSNREAVIRRKLREIGAIAPHEEITCLDAIERLATQNEGHNLTRVYYDKEYPPLVQLVTERNELRTRLELARADTAIARAEAQLTNIREAVVWLWGFWDGNSLRAIPGFEDDIRDAWDRLLAAYKE